MIQAIRRVKSWLGEMAEDELFQKVDVSNACNTISRSACMEEVKKILP